MPTLGEISSTEWSWSIKDFLSLPVKVDAFYDSPLFSFANEYWYLEIFPNGRKEDQSEGYISLYLFRKLTGPSFKIEYTLGMKTVDGKIGPERHITCDFKEFYGYGALRFLRRTDLLERKSDLLPSDTLTLICKMNHPVCTEIASSINTMTTKCSHCNEALDAGEDISSHLRKCDHLPINCRKCGDDVALKNWYDHKCQMTETEGKEMTSKSKILLGNKVFQDYKELFLKQNQSDVLIKVKEQEFPAHRSILAARSPVFESTFRNNMKEKETGIVNIEDCDPSSFSDFLRFLYCGELENLLKENVFSLYTTADKYDVQDLKEICIEFMKENISIDTFCDTITLALQHCESELITLATNFFSKNTLEVVKTVQWQRFSVDNPTQSNELIIKALEAAKEQNK